MLRGIAERFGLRASLKAEAAYVEKLQWLAEDPLCGHVREELAPPESGLRFITANKLLVVVHRVSPEEVLVVHVYDGRTDIRRLLRRDRPA